MEKRVVIINGNGGVGKDTFVNAVSKFKKVKKTSTVDLIKQAATILGYDENRKDEKDRKFLSDLKNLTTEYNNGPIRYIEQSYNEFLNDDNEILFLFIREIDELDMMKKRLNAITLLITNSSTHFITSNEADKNVLNYDYDYTIENSDIESLDNKAIDFINKIFN